MLLLNAGPRKLQAWASWASGGIPQNYGKGKRERRALERGMDVSVQRCSHEQHR